MDTNQPTGAEPPEPIRGWELQRELCLHRRISTREARRRLEDVCWLICEHLAKGVPVSIKGFGQFVFRRRTGRIVRGRLGPTGRPMEENSRDSVFVRFEPSKQLRLVVRQLDPDAVLTGAPRRSDLKRLEAAKAAV